MQTSPTDPAVSVVVATCGRVGLLADMLDGLESQTRRDFELIVVDDESPDGTPELLRDRGVRTIRVSRRGPAYARQVGWEAARAPVVAFTDDDCLPAPGWLEAIASPIEQGRADIVQGRTLPRLDQINRLGPWSRTLRVEREDGLYRTCNIAYRREALERVGGFRTEFAYAAGEDTELALRTLEAGYRSCYEPEALVYHAVSESSYWAYLRDRRRWGQVVRVVRHHPGSRALVYHRYFFRPSHARLLGLLALLVAAGLLRYWLAPLVAAGAFLGYLILKRARGDSVPRLLLRFLQEALVEAFEVGVFVAASIRNRTLLL
ncbi:MAG: glycosyltransferase [Actinomycetota bacterium]